MSSDVTENWSSKRCKLPCEIPHVHKPLNIILLITASWVHQEISTGEKNISLSDCRWYWLSLTQPAISWINVFSSTETAFISNNRHECRNVNGRTRPTNYGTRVKLYKFFRIITAQEADIWLHLSSNHLFWNNIMYIGPQEYHNCVVIYIQLDRSHKLFQSIKNSSSSQQSYSLSCTVSFFKLLSSFIFHKSCKNLELGLADSDNDIAVNQRWLFGKCLPLSVSWGAAPL